MKTIAINIYSFDELNEEAKENARNWFRRGFDFAWSDESLHSIKAFCAEFNITLKDWSVNPYESPSIETNAENSHFRGRNLKAFKRDSMPTGYCLDCDLYATFFDVFKSTGDAKQAFTDAIWQAAVSWRNELEYQLSEESIDDALRVNEYEFLESGDIA